MNTRFNMRRTLTVSIGFLMILVGAMGLLFGGEFRFLGIVAIALSPLIFGLSRKSSVSESTISTNIFVNKYRGFIATWPIGVTVFLSLIVSFYLLHLDSLAGSESVIIVVLFSVSGICAMAYWVYLSRWNMK